MTLLKYVILLSVIPPGSCVAFSVNRGYRDNRNGSSSSCSVDILRRKATGSDGSCTCVDSYDTVMSAIGYSPECSQPRQVSCSFSLLEDRPPRTYLMVKGVTINNHIYPDLHHTYTSVTGIHIWNINEYYTSTWQDITKEGKKYFRLWEMHGKSILASSNLNILQWEGHVIRIMFGRRGTAPCVTVKFKGRTEYPFDIEYFKRRFLPETSTMTPTTKPMTATTTYSPTTTMFKPTTMYTRTTAKTTQTTNTHSPKVKKIRIESIIYISIASLLVILILLFFIFGMWRMMRERTNNEPAKEAKAENIYNNPLGTSNGCLYPDNNLHSLAKHTLSGKRGDDSIPNSMYPQEAYLVPVDTLDQQSAAELKSNLRYRRRVDSQNMYFEPFSALNDRHDITSENSFGSRNAVYTDPVDINTSEREAGSGYTNHQEDDFSLQCNPVYGMSNNQEPNVNSVQQTKNIEECRGVASSLSQDVIYCVPEEVHSHMKTIDKDEHTYDYPM